MKKEVLVLMSGVFAFAVTPLTSRADLEVSASVQIHAKAEFDVPLAAHGTWVEVGSYGRCWRPAHVAVEWRPYGAGEWVWTDCGWYWQSDEPWAWACYHYGAWVYDPHAGWVWVPGVEWAPAWVSWRVGGGYIGWAPLPPPGLVFARHADPGLFVFVGTTHFGGPVRSSTLIIKDNRIITKTSELGGIKREARSLGGPGTQKVMVNHGPAPEMIERASGKKMTAVSIHEASRRTAGPGQAGKGGKQDASGRDKSLARGHNDQGPDRMGGSDFHGKGNDKFSDSTPAKSSGDRGFGSRGNGGSHGGGRGRH